ncbi:molecular chaperone [Stenotrophomonas sp. WHRI 8082]|uniref:fimbrial biogenesis chaperone n=1 Tax=Stenotrophomonas sp. WHRI 8082 TaxID=3162571 RepID=UPI0032EF113F
MPMVNLCLILVISLLPFSLVHASEEDSDGIVLAGTRLIYPSAQKEVTFGLQNESKKPFLIQAWISEDESEATPADAKVPFVIVPPLFRIEEGQRSTLRILQIPNDLPGEQESLFWLSVLAIPGQAAGSIPSPGMMELAIETRIKLIYRPVTLKGNVASAVASLEFSLDKAGRSLTVTNPSPYFVNLVSGTLTQGASRRGLVAVEAIGPGHVLSFGVDGVMDADVGIQGNVEMNYLDDGGLLRTVRLPLLAQRNIHEME